MKNHVRKKNYYVRFIAFFVICLMIIPLIMGCSNKSSAGTESTDSPKTTDTQNVPETQQNESDNNANNDNSSESTLTQTQKNSIDMLNYLAMISQKIESSKSNRLYLEEVYSFLVNNTNPDKIDQTSQNHMADLLDIIEDYRMVSVRRDRIQMQYDQANAHSLRNGITNSANIVFDNVSEMILNFMEKDWRGLALTAGSTIASVAEELFFVENLDDFESMGWELDDIEAGNIHKNRKQAFNYMVNMVRDYNLPGNLSLNEESIQSFVETTNDDNVYQKLQFLESKESVYSTFAPYWLERASCYYETEEYEKCLSCVEKYKDVYTGIFRKDYSYARFLPKAIVAAQSIYNGKEYENIISTYTKAILDNSEDKDWTLKYFAATSYIDLYNKTGDNSYLQSAYDVTLNNVNYLVFEQKKLNNTYLNDVVDLKLDNLEIGTSLSSEEKERLEKSRKEEQKKLDELNKSIKNGRKIECSTLYEPLVLNCDVLFDLAEKLEISNAEKAKISGILQSDKSGVFLVKTVNDRFSFDSQNQEEFETSLSKDEFIISADMITSSSTITAIVTTGETEKAITDWSISNVERSGNNISSYRVHCTSNDWKAITWNSDAKATIIISYDGVCDDLEINFEVTNYNDNWWFFPDDVEFTRI